LCIYFDEKAGTEYERCYYFKNILAKKFCEKMAFFAQTKARVCKNWIITLVFENNNKFVAENCQKLQKIVIITSTPGWATFWAIFSQTHPVTLPFSLLFAVLCQRRRRTHRNLKSRSRIKPWNDWVKTCPSYEHPKTIHVLNTLP
jgi:hypothetical protein